MGTLLLIKSCKYKIEVSFIYTHLLLGLLLYRKNDCLGYAADEWKIPKNIIAWNGMEGLLFIFYICVKKRKIRIRNILFDLFLSLRGKLLLPSSLFVGSLSLTCGV